MNGIFILVILQLYQQMQKSNYQFSRILLLNLLKYKLIVIS